MFTIFLSLLLSTASASEYELDGQNLADSMMPMIYAGVGIEAVTILYVSTADFGTCSLCGLQAIAPLAIGTGIATGIAGVGVSRGMVGNKRMIEDLRSRNIAVEKKYLRYAKLSRNLVAGTLVASIATMSLTSIDELFILPPLFVIPMVVFTEKQRRISLDAYQRASGSIEPSYRNTFHVSLVPTSNSLSLVGTF